MNRKGYGMNGKVMTAPATAGICIGVAVAHPRGLGLWFMGATPPNSASRYRPPRTSRSTPAWVTPH